MSSVTVLLRWRQIPFSARHSDWHLTSQRFGIGKQLHLWIQLQSSPLLINLFHTAEEFGIETHIENSVIMGITRYLDVHWHRPPKIIELRLSYSICLGIFQRFDGVAESSGLRVVHYGINFGFAHDRLWSRGQVMIYFYLIKGRCSVG